MLSKSKFSLIASFLLLSILCVSQAQEALHLTGTNLVRTAWNVTADSFESQNPPHNAIDGNTSTFWHSEYSPSLLPLPHNITLDLKAVYNISALTYLPRQDGNSNGNIGQHTVQVSQDSIQWATVSIGTWIDDAFLKTSAFQTTPGRYVGLTGLTEAGNRGPWSSAAEINVWAQPSYTPPSPATLGVFGPTIDFPVVPVSAALLYTTGELLIWSSYSPYNYNGGAGKGNQTASALYNPMTGASTARLITNTQQDMFCVGLSILGNGSILVAGGNSDDSTNFYEPNLNTWVASGKLKDPRGYQAQVTLSNDNVFTIGGSWSGARGGKNGEVYNPATDQWTALPGALVAPMLTNDHDGVYRADNHAWLFAWSNATVFQAGPSRAMNWYYATGSGNTTPAGPRGTNNDSMNGNAVMYDAVNGKILTVGGALDYQYAYATNSANLITVGAPGTTASVQALTSMHYARAFGNSVVMPNGRVFIVGGQTYPIPFSDANATLPAEIYDPIAQTFSVVASISSPRNYHSFALLMTDATIISGGGGLCGECSTNHFDAEIYRPAYLFNSDGSLATRPSIISVSSTSLQVGSTFSATVSTSGGQVTSWSLIRMGSATHTVNTDQRRIALTAAGSGTTFTFKLPTDPGIVIPGNWMLFALNSVGVPSLAETVLVHL